MTKEVFYTQKVSPNGRVTYSPVSVYDSGVTDALPKGAHLILVGDGFTSRMYNVDPALAPMIAAGRFAQDKIVAELVKTSEIRMQKRLSSTPLTESQRAAWAKLIEEFGPSATQLEWPCAREIAEAGTAAMQKEADKILQNPAVKKAWDNFMTIYSLVKDDLDTSDR